MHFVLVLVFEVGDVLHWRHPRPRISRTCGNTDCRRAKDRQSIFFACWRCDVPQHSHCSTPFERIASGPNQEFTNSNLHCATSPFVWQNRAAQTCHTPLRTLFLFHARGRACMIYSGGSGPDLGRAARPSCSPPYATATVCPASSSSSSSALSTRLQIVKHRPPPFLWQDCAARTCHTPLRTLFLFHARLRACMI